MTFQSRPSADNLISDAWSYGVDAMQRSIFFWDLLRKRGNNYVEHCANGQPPVLVFDYETIIDGRELDPAVNYAWYKSSTAVERNRIGDLKKRSQK
jgi:hypothetical protein